MPNCLVVYVAIICLIRVQQTNNRIALKAEKWNFSWIYIAFCRIRGHLNLRVDRADIKTANYRGDLSSLQRTHTLSPDKKFFYNLILELDTMAPDEAPI